MIVVFDIWVMEPGRQYSPQEELLFKTFYELVYDRLVYLWDEIENEEKLRAAENPCIMVELVKKRLSFHGYTPALTEKLKGSFNENDSIMLSQRLDEAFKHFK